MDLNSDLGESFGPWSMGDDTAMMSLVTSANVACGGHASDPETMFATLSSAVKHGVVIGAHPGYPDREGFGRRIIPMTEGEIERVVAAQVGALMGIAAIAGTHVRYVKPHGALGNLAADNRGVADAIARAIRAISSNLAVLAISGTELQPASEAAHLQFYSEIFADRAYLKTGRLVPALATRCNDRGRRRCGRSYHHFSSVGSDADPGWGPDPASGALNLCPRGQPPCRQDGADSAHATDE
jgi:5-oxoprolinase (ATP-hydrolysing) subunit A